MLSDEEKKAIEMIEHIQECNTLIGYRVEDRTILAKALLNLIEKQSKEIEEIKKEAYNFGYRNGCNDTSKFNDKTFIRIDKIKAKIEEVKDGTYDAKIVLQSLLEKE